jgi:hypothetical protein
MADRFEFGDAVVVVKSSRPPEKFPGRIGERGVVFETSSTFGLLCVRFDDGGAAWYQPAELSRDGDDGSSP